MFFSNVSCTGYLLISTINKRPDFLHHINNNLWLPSLLTSIYLPKSHQTASIKHYFLHIIHFSKTVVLAIEESLRTKPWHSELPTAVATLTFPIHSSPTQNLLPAKLAALAQQILKLKTWPFRSANPNLWFLFNSSLSNK